MNQSLTLLACCTFAASAAAAQTLQTPETSPAFRKHTDPETGVVSYILERPRLGLNHQSLYFTHKSMTDDGRFLVFNVSGGGFGDSAKLLAVFDFLTGDSRIISNFGGIPFLDVRTDQLYYINKAGVFRHDLLVDPLQPILLCTIPDELTALGKISYFCTHLTLTHDRTQAFLDLKGGDLYVQGLLNLQTGRFTKWGETDFFINHGQIHPFRDDLALCAWENLKGKLIDGVYQRLWLLEPNGKRTMIPPVHTNYATHEHWSEDGKGFYFCSNGVYYHDLETGQQRQLVPMKAAHAAISADNQLATFDYSVGKWYRGCAWSIGFYNLKTQKGLYFYPKLEPFNDIDHPSKLHPDPHPQFVCNDRYIISTVNLGSGNMDLSITPVQQLLELTASTTEESTKHTK